MTSVTGCNSHNNQNFSTKSDLELNNLQGAVKTVIIEETQPPIGDVVYDTTKTIYHYNEQGMIIRKETNDEIIDYRYNKNRQLVEKKATLLWTENRINVIETYQYDSQGFLIKTNSSDGITLRHENIVENGKLKKTLTYSTLDKLATMVEYNYNEDCTEKIIQEYWTGGEIDTIIVRCDKVIANISHQGNSTQYEYNTNNELIVETLKIKAFETPFDSSDAKTHTFHYEYSDYDQYGNWTKRGKKYIDSVNKSVEYNDEDNKEQELDEITVRTIIYR